jgi:hypothetical protein
MIQRNGLKTKDKSDNQFFTNTNHETKKQLSHNGKDGIFLSDGNIILRSGQTDVIIGKGNIQLNGNVVNKNMINEKSRAQIENPTNFLPGDAIPPLIIPSITYLPNIKTVMQFFGFGLTMMSVASSVTKLLGGDSE